MSIVKQKYGRLVAKVYAGDFGVNQAAEVGGLVAAAIAITAGVATQGDQVGQAIATFFTDKLS